jgi:hypothetical protein
MANKNFSLLAWLAYLYYFIGKQNCDFWLCGLKKTEEGVISTKWKRYSQVCFAPDIGEDWKICWVNQRQVLPNEVVLDIENKEQLNPIIEKLKKLGLIFYVFSAGKGVHIHVFFDRELSEGEKLKIINHFGADTQKASNKTMIALEFTPHWKSQKIKEMIAWK